MSCVVWGCNSHSSRKQINENIMTFHRFPKDDVKKMGWVNRIGRRNWNPKKHSHICSRHFSPDSFVCSENMKWRRLREEAVPTLFIEDKAHEMQPIEVCEEGQGAVTYLTERQVRMKVFEPTSCEIISQESVTQMPGDTTSELFLLRRIKILEKDIERVKKISKRRLRKINNLTKRVSRLKKKNADLYSTLMPKLKQDNVETEYITMMDNINKNDIIVKGFCKSK